MPQRITFISDTHNLHNRLDLVPGGVLCHCGDFTLRGTHQEIKDFSKWWIAQAAKFSHTILIPGNHDGMVEKLDRSDIKDLFTPYRNQHYLVDDGIWINGISFWGSPWCPCSYWKVAAYGCPVLSQDWMNIPINVDVLLTHVPSKGVLDTTYGGDHPGCERLLDKLKTIDYKIHAFGHIHEARGTEQHPITGQLSINAAICDLNYNPVNAPIVVEIGEDDGIPHIL